MSFHSKVEPEKEICEIKSQSQPVGSCQLFIKRIKMKHSSGLVGIIVDCPDIAGIDKNSEF